MLFFGQKRLESQYETFMDLGIVGFGAGHWIGIRQRGNPGIGGWEFIEAPTPPHQEWT